MSIEISYITSEGCGYGSRDATESLSWFLEKRHPTLAGLIELLVEQGVLSVEAVYEKFKTSNDYELERSGDA